jgi:hypothetical protein
MLRPTFPYCIAGAGAVEVAGPVAQAAPTIPASAETAGEQLGAASDHAARAARSTAAQNSAPIEVAQEGVPSTRRIMSGAWSNCNYLALRLLGMCFLCVRRNIVLLALYGAIYTTLKCLHCVHLSQGILEACFALLGTYVSGASLYNSSGLVWLLRWCYHFLSANLLSTCVVHAISDGEWPTSDSNLSQISWQT